MFENIKRINELNDVDKVNKYLSEGWVIIDIQNKNEEKVVYGDSLNPLGKRDVSKTTYILGKKNE